MRRFSRFLLFLFFLSACSANNPPQVVIDAAFEHLDNRMSIFEENIPRFSHDSDSFELVRSARGNLSHENALSNIDEKWCLLINFEYHDKENDNIIKHITDYRINRIRFKWNAERSADWIKENFYILNYEIDWWDCKNN